MSKKVDNFGGKKVMPDNPMYDEYKKAQNLYFKTSSFDSNLDEREARYRDIKKKALEWERKNTTYFGGERK